MGCALSRQQPLYSPLNCEIDFKVFSFKDLKAATKNVKKDALLGESGFCEVYKGRLDARFASNNKARQMVAIRKMTFVDLNSDDLQQEINFLGSISHPNVAKLLGYCKEDGNLLLVYEFMRSGSLENHLFQNVKPLAWDTRLKIAIDAARGLTFLHTQDNQAQYRDFKSFDILLDEEYNAEVSYFGLAKSRSIKFDGSIPITAICPEYMGGGAFTIMSDVYGIGIVLLEMLTGLQYFDKRRPGEQRNLVVWVQNCDLLDDRTILDDRLKGQLSDQAMIKTAQLIRNCILDNPRERPSMQDVLVTLQEIRAMQN